MTSHNGAGRNLFDPEIAKEALRASAIHPVDSRADERRAFRACWRTIKGLKLPTLERFLRHAKHYGNDLVLETAEDFLSAADLITLKTKLRALAVTGPRKGIRRPRLLGKGHRQRNLSRDETRRIAQFLIAEGKMVSVAANFLGVGEKYLKALLKEPPLRA